MDLTSLQRDECYIDRALNEIHSLKLRVRLLSNELATANNKLDQLTIKRQGINTKKCYGNFRRTIQMLRLKIPFLLILLSVSVHSQQLRLSWLEESADQQVTNYNIYIGGAKVATVASVAPAFMTNQWLFTAVPGTNTISVTAVNSFGLESDPASIGYVFPTAPSGLSISSGGGSTTVSWISNPSWQNITGYKIYELISGSKTLIGQVGSSVASFSFPRQPGTHTYYVSALNMLGEGPFSQSVDVNNPPMMPTGLQVTRP